MSCCSHESHPYNALESPCSAPKQLDTKVSGCLSAALVQGISILGQKMKQG